MNGIPKVANILWNPLMSGNSNVTLSELPGVPIVTGVIIGGSIGGMFVVLVLVGCIIYYKRQRDRNKKEYALGHRSPSYVALELPQSDQNERSIIDPLEKRPYTQLLLPLGAKPKEKSKYGVCRYKIKGETTPPGSTQPPNAVKYACRNEQQTMIDINEDYTVIENTQKGIELYNLPSYDLVVGETT